MTFIEELRQLVTSGILTQPFTVADVKRVTNNPEANNLSNYAVDNAGSSNRNNKVLGRKENKSGVYEYWFL